VLGTGAIGKVIASLAEGGARPFEIIGFLDDNPNAPETVPSPHVLLGKIQDLPTLVEETRPDLIVVAQMNRRGNFPAKALIDCRMRGIQVEDWPAFYEKETGKILVTDLRPSWLIFSDGFVKTARNPDLEAPPRRGAFAGGARACPSRHGPGRGGDQAGVSRARSVSPGASGRKWTGLHLEQVPIDVRPRREGDRSGVGPAA
jgi:hypothetical protein